MRIILLCLAVAIAPIFAQQNPPGDTLLFMEGLNLSYNNRYADARAKLAEYERLHPDDVLASLRILYNRFFETGHGERLSSDGYREFLAELDAAIRKYETKDCHAIDFSASGRSLDCAYVGAALYSLRMTLRGLREGWLRVGDDRKKFLTYAAWSRAPQIFHLLGVYEYEPSRLSRWKRMALAVAGVPTDRDHAIRTFMRSLEGNESPFVDDIWLTVLKIERETDGKNPCDADRRDESPAVQELLLRYPPRRVLGYLQSKYPGNHEVQVFVRACGNSIK